jgi:hypothetical protein
MMPNISEALPMLTWAVDMAAPFALGTSFQYSIKSDAQPIGNPLNGEVWFGEFTSLSAGKLITGTAAVIYNEAGGCWLPLSVAFRYGENSYDVQFTCVLRVGRIMLVTLELSEETKEET